MKKGTTGKVSITDNLVPKQTLADLNRLAKRKPASEQTPIDSNIAETDKTKKPSRKTVLEEDEYVQRMSAVISRDFFPDLKRLKTVADYTDALRDSDPIRMRQILQDQHASVKEYFMDKELPLDKFQGEFTSEDNQSFSELQREESREKLRLMQIKYSDPLKRIQQKKPQELTASDSVKLLEYSRDSNNITAEPSDTAELKNALMYGPDPNGKSVSYLDASHHEAKIIKYENTRLSQTTISTNNSTSTKIKTPYLSVAATPTPGFNHTSTTQQCQTPLMTWGNLESTPVVVGGTSVDNEIDVGPLELHTGGREFRIPDVPRREQIAKKLGDQATKKLSISANKPSDTLASNIRKCSGSEVRAAALSPAARNLLKRSSSSSSTASPWNMTPSPILRPTKK